MREFPVFSLSVYGFLIHILNFEALGIFPGLWLGSAICLFFSHDHCWLTVGFFLTGLKGSWAFKPGDWVGGWR